MKADLHLHSRFSERAPEWIFRQAGLQGSYSRPAELYEQLRAAGMSLITLTDHNTLDGCLTIAERPGVFLSEQITTHFPEDRCGIHLLVWGLDEKQHRETVGFRENIYELSAYLREQCLAHGVAHPLYKLDDRFSLSHLEKLILLFSHFEGLNGLRDGLFSTTAQFILGQLSPEKVEELANRHNLTPTHAQPWRKVFFGGSDDHGGMAAGRAWTEAPAGATLADFLAHLREGRCKPAGKVGTPLVVSHGLYNNLRQFVGERFREAESSTLVGKAFSRFMEGRDPTEFTWGEKFGFVAQGIATGTIFELAKPANASLWKQFSATFSADDLKTTLAREMAGIQEPERRAFTIANRFANQLAYRFFKSFLGQISSGNIIEAIREISMLLPILATLTPYVYSFRKEAPDREQLRTFSKALTGTLPPELQNRKRAWFTDTLEDVNGVSTTIRKLTAACVAEGFDLSVITSLSQVKITEIPIKNFEPIGDFELPEYELQKLSFPPVLEIVDYIQREGFTELIISTPGPVGLTALLAGKLLGIRTSGIYHTDFPQYVRILSEDASLETLTWNFMRWFYGLLDVVYVNSPGYLQAWKERGIPEEQLRILPRGLDTELFNPSRRDDTFWTTRGAAPGTKVLLYVGRISREKDLEVLVAAWHRLKTDRCTLALVGDGPFARELKSSLPDAIFTGYLSGNDLARAFASADLFVFPSTTDTFGNVVIEALASGLPCVVSDLGGPKDLITPGVTGYITPALNAEAFAAAVDHALNNLTNLAEMGKAARHSVEARDWRTAARDFWAVTADCAT